eukprot:TRINITY_DN83826_c0_g1_i1.p1 TRINITY_DN83826_c0_g1~~TRINITY_DN83826_c0_g1_i1.p1  ORF type:complete len:453 (-),score=34.65 TRINITY_DN83826_c0_g1_i1:1-1359(-)
MVQLLLLSFAIYLSTFLCLGFRFDDVEAKGVSRKLSFSKDAVHNITFRTGKKHKDRLVYPHTSKPLRFDVIFNDYLRSLELGDDGADDVALRLKPGSTSISEAAQRTINQEFVRLVKRIQLGCSGAQTYEPSEMLDQIRTGKLKISQGQSAYVRGDYLSAQTHGIIPIPGSKGSTNHADFGIVSLPSTEAESGSWLFTQSIYIAGWFSIGFAGVWDPAFGDDWLCRVMSNIQKLLALDMKLVVLTKADGSVGMSQTIEIKLLRRYFKLKPCPIGNPRATSCFHTMPISTFIRSLTPAMEAIAGCEHLAVTKCWKLDDKWSEVKRLVDMKVPDGAPDHVNYIDPLGYNAMHRAARHGAPKDVLSVLQDKGVDINLRAWQQDEQIAGITPLFLAVKYGHKDTVKALLELKADTKMRWKNMSLAEYARYLSSGAVNICEGDLQRITELLQSGIIG